ncbi:hypothetical protein F751_2644 [Auxenochlorella protothecoides]|uniref:Uncharacterized protein n=1 Tax=Auxenochlorella protothecoides TaxID=3075 RepID=A0A087SL23_AUXPR|nr:hypothetical protein F751_2644 [Auxenochlorella protothecoides]KFM26427.1 hypothetical protein F751_2644 [Auxenochlorella protothecoides]
MSSNTVSIINNVTVYLPECAVHVTADSISYTGSQEFQPTTWEYFKGFVPTVLPGVILGGLALIGLIFFLVWICVQACRLRKKPDSEAHSEKDRLTEPFAMASGPGMEPGKHAPRHAILFIVFTLLLGLAVVGVSAWGMALSIQSTKDQIPGFWAVVDDINSNATAIQGYLANINSSVLVITPGLNVIVDEAATLVSLIAEEANVTVSTSDIRNTAQSLVTELGERVTRLYGNSVWTVTQRVQHTYRFIPIAIVFGVVILLTLILLWLGARMKYPKTTSFVVALYWTSVALLMFLGVGLLNGIFEVANDACRYSETYAHDRIRSSMSSRNLGLFDRVWSYYIVNTPISVPYADYITGAPVQEVLAALQTSDVDDIIQALSRLNTTVIQTQTGLSSSDAAAVSTAVQAIPTLLKSIVGLVASLSRENLRPIYLNLKVLACCTMANKVHSTWVSWTVAGVLAFVFALLLSARVISHTVVTARRRRVEEEEMQRAFMTSVEAFDAYHASMPPGQPAPSAQPPPSAGANHPSSGHAGYYDGRYNS